MKPIVKQKLSTLQDIINNAQSGGGGTVDAYTKAEADAKFETITGAASTYLSKSDAASTYLSKSDAASTYLSKTDAANMVNKQSVEGEIIRDDLQFNFSIADFNLLGNSVVIFDLKNNTLPNRIIIMCIIINNGTDLYIYKADGSSDSSLTINFLNQTLTLSIILERDFSDVFAGTATIIY